MCTYFFSEIDLLNEESVKTLDDIKGLQEYLEKRQKYFTSKQVELKGVQENVKKLNARMEQLKQSIIMLESECLAKNIDPKDTSNHAQEFVMALKVSIFLNTASQKFLKKSRQKNS